MPVLSLSSFVQTDAMLLSERNRVRLVDCRSLSGVVRTMIAAFSSDVVFCWFASLWFLPVILVARLRRKPVVVVCGGYDVASLPAIGYGNMRSPLYRAIGKLVFRAASVVLPFSESAHREARQNVGVRAQKLQMIYLGIESRLGADAVAVAKKPVVLTVSNIDASTLIRKGLLIVAQVSRLMPDVQFVVAGRGQPEALATLREACGPNVLFTGFVDAASLEQLMGSSKVIFQPSLHEGFGMSVAEGMLHGAIPVVSARFSLPEVVGNAGLYGDPDDPSTFVPCIRAALTAGSHASEQARTQIVQNFSLEKRRVALQGLIDAIFAVKEPSAVRAVNHQASAD